MNAPARYCECWVLWGSAMDVLATHAPAASRRARNMVRDPPDVLFRRVYKPVGTQPVACFLSASH